MPIRLEHAAVINGQLALVFDDGMEIYLEGPMLRRACPCAVCQGEPDAMGRVIRPRLSLGPKAFELQRFEVVGGYALQLFWGDGHSSGIYSFDYCRQLSEPPAGGAES